MKKILMSLILCMFVVGVTSSVGAMIMIGDPVEGNSWSQSAVTENEPNLVNLWSTTPFEYATVSTGTYWQSSDGYWAQWFTTEDPSSGQIAGTMTWTGSIKDELWLDLQECYYNWDTGEIGPSWNYGYYWSGFPDFNWVLLCTYPNAGGLVDCPPPVPIPTSVLLLGAGLLGLIIIRRRQA